MAADETEYLRHKVAGMLKTVPNRVNGGSIQVAREFKRFYKEAATLLGKSRATKEQLNTLHNRTLEWYQ